jgi:hypothetical protein
MTFFLTTEHYTEYEKFVKHYGKFIGQAGLILIAEIEGGLSMGVGRWKYYALVWGIFFAASRGNGNQVCQR